jgi:hypothetical protein
MVVLVTWMSSASIAREWRRDVLIMLETLIIMRSFDYARNSYRNEFIDFPPCTSSHASPNFFHGPNHRSYVLIHERMTLCLDALVTAHVLIVVIVPRVGTVFLLEGVTLIVSRDTWTVHVSPIVIYIPLPQMVRCKRL